jgi:hypothetical protein
MAIQKIANTLPTTKATGGMVPAAGMPHPTAAPASMKGPSHNTTAPARKPNTKAAMAADGPMGCTGTTCAGC